MQKAFPVKASSHAYGNGIVPTKLYSGSWMTRSYLPLMEHRKMDSHIKDKITIKSLQTWTINLQQLIRPL